MNQLGLDQQLYQLQNLVLTLITSIIILLQKN